MSHNCQFEENDKLKYFCMPRPRLQYKKKTKYHPESAQLFVTFNSIGLQNKFLDITKNKKN